MIFWFDTGEIFLYFNLQGIASTIIVTLFMQYDYLAQLLQNSEIWSSCVDQWWENDKYVKNYFMTNICLQSVCKYFGRKLDRE